MFSRRHISMAAALCTSMFFSAFLFASGETDNSADSGRTKLVIATDATWPPMEYVDENREVVGFGPDMMKAIAEAADFDVEIRNTAWDGIFAGLAAGSYDAICSSVTITDERKESMDFSEPYVNAGQVLVVTKDQKAVTSLSDLAGERVGAQIGTTGAIEIGKVSTVTLASYDEVGLAFEDLMNGRIAGVVADSPIAADFALQNERYKDKLMIVGEPFTDEWLGIAVQKGDTESLRLINEGLEKIKADGTLEKIANKWLR